MIVYGIKNIIVNKFYIGRSNTKYRIHGHICDLRANKHHSIKLQRAYNKYGESVFVFGIIEDNIPDDLIQEKEKYYVELYNSYHNGYNCTKGGEHDSKYWLGKKEGAHNTAKKTYQYTLDGTLVKEWNSVISITRTLGYTHEMICGCCIGKYKTTHNYIWTHIYQGEKIEVYRKTTSQIKTVASYDLNTNLKITEYPSAIIASLALSGKTKSKISDVCNGRRNSALGYKWKYID